MTNFHAYIEMNPEPCQTCKMERSAWQNAQSLMFDRVLNTPAYEIFP